MSNTVPFPTNYCQIALDEGTEVRIHQGGQSTQWWGLQGDFTFSAQLNLKNYRVKKQNLHVWLISLLW